MLGCLPQFHCTNPPPSLSSIKLYSFPMVQLELNPTWPLWGSILLAVIGSASHPSPYGIPSQQVLVHAKTWSNLSSENFVTKFAFWWILVVRAISSNWMDVKEEVWEVIWVSFWCESHCEDKSTSKKQKSGKPLRNGETMQQHFRFHCQFMLHVSLPCTENSNYELKIQNFKNSSHFGHLEFDFPLLTHIHTQG
jgi:hypothetical protein